MPCSPSSPICGHRSRGNTLSRSISAARGAILSREKSCTVDRSWSRSSPRPKSNPVHALGIIGEPVPEPVRRPIGVTRAATLAFPRQTTAAGFAFEVKRTWPRAAVGGTTRSTHAPYLGIGRPVPKHAGRAKSSRVLSSCSEAIPARPLPAPRKCKSRCIISLLDDVAWNVWQLVAGRLRCYGVRLAEARVLAAVRAPAKITN